MSCGQQKCPVETSAYLLLEAYATFRDSFRKVPELFRKCWDGASEAVLTSWRLRYKWTMVRFAAALVDQVWDQHRLLKELFCYCGLLSALF